MKRTVISIGLLLVCLGASATQLFYICGNVNESLAIIEQIDTYMRKDDFRNALSDCAAINEKWGGVAKKVDSLLIHDYVDGISLSLAKMQTHIENGNPDMYFAESEKAKKALASIRDSEYPYAENIL